MFRYFPTNYVWNLSVDLAIEMGARIGEIEEMCAPLQEASKQTDAAKRVEAWPQAATRDLERTVFRLREEPMIRHRFLMRSWSP